MTKTLGIDMGTSSIGLSVRETDSGKTIQDQLEYCTSVIFKTGVGNSKTGEFSYAAERTRHRSVRRLYQARKYRIWETLKKLIEFDFCPLSHEDLERWSRYDKAKGLKRQYPVDSHKFEEWVRLDFNGDGVSDYSSPFQLRAELMEKQFDFENQVDRFKLGRAIYHIAQRRGFKSSKGETIKENEKIAAEKNEEHDLEIDLTAELKKSEEKKSKDLVAYMNLNGFKTVGCAFAQLENDGLRVRASEYQAVRSQYKDEINEIFKFQEGLDTNGIFYKGIVSEKKGEGSIFYKRPLRSQKGLIGKCTLEPSKSRCAVSHPDFETFRAWSFINNIKYRRNNSDNWLELTTETKQQLFNEKFLRVTTSFKFEEIQKWLEKKNGFRISYKEKTINYKENTNVSGCPISGRLKKIFGEDWNELLIKTTKKRINKKTGEVHDISYNTNDIWHICFSFDETENVEVFAKSELLFDNEKTKELVRLWGAIPQGYSMLSLKAIKNINRFLKRGFIYTEAVLLAKLPEILGEELWVENEDNIIKSVEELLHQNRETKRIYSIVNSLIANYKSLGFNDDLNVNERIADNTTGYKLTASDFEEIEKSAQESYGFRVWESMPKIEKEEILHEVAKYYQRFFASLKRDYVKLPKLGDTIKKYLCENFSFLRCANNFEDKNDDKLVCSCIACKKLNKLYHPSLIEFYKPAKEVYVENNDLILSKRLLESPVIGAFKNPMAMRAMHILRKQINALLISGLIDEDTRIVIETARDLNDANMRWAIEAFQREREKENKEFEAAIKEHFPTRIISNDDIDKARLLIDQQNISEILTLKKEEIIDTGNKKRTEKIDTYKKDVTKYRLWLEQGCRCIYTGKLINITTLFDENKVDFEHTIPRSISFDNSLANLTVCDAYFNRMQKKNQIPTQLDEYDSILSRIQPWIEKVEKLKDNVEFWRGKSKSAQDKDYKDFAIRQRHLWQMEQDYWRNKVERFTMKEVTTGFKNSQLVDTRMITKYAYHYLRSVFSKVEVQKGSVTADFRKILGVQGVIEKKNRDKHSHHAIDATMLTLIPVSAKRDRMLELFFKIAEGKKLNRDVSSLKSELDKEVRGLGIGRDVSLIGRFIEENILINHISKDQTLVPSRKKARKRGKEIFVKNSQGETVNKWINGDIIRGKLHGETFYGAIKQALKDENGTFLKNDDGNVKVGEEVFYVVRKDLKFRKNTNDTGFYDWEDMEKVIVNKRLLIMMQKQFETGVSFKDACEKGIYMLDKKGNRVNRIRHIRCYAPQIKNPLVIKRHTYLSDKTYKQSYYAEMRGLYVMCKYVSQDMGEKKFVIYSLFDISQNRQNGLEDIPTIIHNLKGQKLELKSIIKDGEMILLYKDKKDELVEMDLSQLSERLYVVRGFESDGNRIILQKHNNAQPYKELGKGESVRDYAQMPNKIRSGINTLKFLQKEIDFEMNANGIEFK